MFKETFRSGGLVALVAAIAVSVIAAGCGGDDASPTAAATTRPSGAASTGATSAATTATTSGTLGQKFTGSIPAGAPRVDQTDLAFKPDKIAVKLGDTVYFSNSEAALHSVNVDGKNILGQGANMKQNEMASWKAARAGTYVITCDYHPAMKATVTVQ